MFQIGLLFFVGLFAVLSHGAFNTELKLVGLVFAGALVSTLSIRGLRVPRLLIIVAVFSGFIAYFYSETIRNKRIVLVELDGDKDFVNSSRFMGYLPRSQAWFGRISSFSELEELHRKNPQASIMIWGNEKFLVLSMGDLRKTELAGYQMIESVPFIGLNKVEGCEVFINALAKGIADNSDEDLNKALRVRYRWRTEAHRAYPLFLLANKRLLAGMYDDKTEELYLRAAGFIRANENPNLRGAIMNNLALTYLKRGENKEKVVNTFEYARRSQRELSPFGEKIKAGRIAEKNLKRFKKESREKGNRKN
jgi:hypothetical protein